MRKSTQQVRAEKHIAQRLAAVKSRRVRIWNVYVNFNDRFDVNLLVLRPTKADAKRTAISAARDEAGDEEGG